MQLFSIKLCEAACKNVSSALILISRSILSLTSIIIIIFLFLIFQTQYNTIQLYENFF